jgi:antitoxin component YwqK of YwqJK toxin-antitoxin module
MVNGREWGEWKFYDREGKLDGTSRFQKRRTGWPCAHLPPERQRAARRLVQAYGKEDSLRVSRYRDGDIMERGSYTLGKKIGEWRYYNPIACRCSVEAVHR